MEFLKICLACVLAAVTYGVLNNLITAHLCVEFFRLFDVGMVSSNPIVVAIVYGVLTTWWVGLILGVLIASAATVGGPPRLEFADVVRPIGKLMLALAVFAVVGGVLAYFLWPDFADAPEIAKVFSVVPPDKRQMAFAVNGAHTADYFGGLIGGLAVCVSLIMRRAGKRNSSRAESRSRTAMEDFDAVLCHNSVDKPHVRQLNEALKEGRIRTWLDEEQLRLGLPWQPELEKHMGEVRCALVCIGRDGLGPWQQMEMSVLLNQLLRRRCPVIPVILPDAGEIKVPLFLEQLTWVDLRANFEKGIRRLIGEIRSIERTDPA